MLTMYQLMMFSGDSENQKAYIRLIRDAGKPFSLLAGNAGAVLPSLKEGGAGDIAGRANLYPNSLASIYNRFISGNTAQAEKLRDAVPTLQRVFRLAPNTIIKKVVAMLGYSAWQLPQAFQLPLGREDRRTAGGYEGKGGEGALRSRPVFHLK